MFCDKYKKIIEEQKKMIGSTIEQSEKWRDLSLEIQKSYDKAIKDLKEATDFIQILQKKNEELILKLAFYKSKP